MPTRFVTFLMATAFFEQVTTSLIRVTTTYRAVELDLSVVWLGIITAAFAMLPIGLAAMWEYYRTAMSTCLRD